jgi:hypothetical protein
MNFIVVQYLATNSGLLSNCWLNFQSNKS